jgi:hypothetical protein
MKELNSKLEILVHEDITGARCANASNSGEGRQYKKRGSKSPVFTIL